MAKNHNLENIVILSVILSSVTSFPSFRDRIPNGHHVPFPCRPGEIWNGVGHYLPGGSGPRNPFGDDFEAGGKIWTKRLCQKDSDGDGKTNGEELGDPHCEWKEGDEPCVTDPSLLSHPGICDPWNSVKCLAKEVDHPIWTTQEIWLREYCDLDGFNCPNIQQEGVFQVSVKLNPTKVPPTETTYICQNFDLSDLNIENEDLHILAARPDIENKNLVNHILLYGCDDNLELSGKPYSCENPPSPKCTQLLSGWIGGTDGFCTGDESGIRIGKRGVKKLALQIHWNNRKQQSGFRDSSGLNLYLTSSRLNYDSTILLVGTEFFSLPARQNEVVVNGKCGSKCTQANLKGTVFATFALNQLRSTGKSISMRIYRKGKLVKELTNDINYDIRKPKVYTFYPAVEIRPGDEIRTQCIYDTSKQRNDVFSGPAASNEVCYGFISVYPQKNVKKYSCTDIQGVNLCDSDTFNKCQVLVYSDDQKVQKTKFFKSVMRVCDKFVCTEDCMAYLRDQKLSNPCLKENIWTFIKILLGFSDKSVIDDFIEKTEVCGNWYK